MVDALTSIPLHTHIVLAAFGFVVAMLMHLCGVGAGVLLVPALIITLGMSAAQSVGTVGLYSILFRCGSLWSLFHSGQIHTGAMWRFGAFALPSSLLAAVVFGWIPSHYPLARPILDTLVRVLVMVAALVALAALYLRSFKDMLGRLGMRTLGAAVGALMGSTGAGGGILIVPALLSTTQLTPGQAVGTSSAIAMGLTLATTLVFGVSGAIRWAFVPSLVIGAYAALPLADAAAKRLSQKTIVDIVASLIVLAILSMAVPWML